MRVLGVDPSIAHMGLVVLECRGHGQAPDLLHAATVKTSPGSADGDRLAALAEEVANVASGWQVDAVGVEKTFVGRARGRSLVLLSMAAGAACGAAAVVGVPVYVVDRSVACKALAGRGKLTKGETQTWVRSVVGLGGRPLPQDQSDAAAVAIAAADRHRSALARRGL